MTAASAGADDACPLPLELTARLLQGGVVLGDLPVTTGFTVDEAALLDEGVLRATVEGSVDVAALALRQSVELCVFLVLDVDGEALLAHSQRLALDDFGQVASVRYVLREDLPEGTRRMTFVVREQESGLWGAMPMEEPALSIAGPGFGAVRVAEREGTYYELKYRDEPTSPSSAEVADRAPSPGSGGAPEAAPSTRVTPPGGDPSRPSTTVRAPSVSDRAPDPRRVAERGAVVRIVPPRGRVEGSTTIDVITSSQIIDKVVFEVDGRVVGEDGREPFRERVPLAEPAREQVVRVIAYDNFGEVMGEDTLRVNVDDTPFRVRLRLGLDTSTTETATTATMREVGVRIGVQVPADARLERVELLFGERPLETFAASDLTGSDGGRDRTVETRIRVPSSPEPTDFVRAVATLADGSSIDDVVLLAAPADEEVDVNLAQVHVFVTDGDGRPVTDLEVDDFTVVLGGEREIASFAHAEDVPLVLGLMIDASGSMRLMMQDTQRAAAKFLGQTLLPQDEAFLVDFDQQPRLLRPPTSDLTGLIRSLGEINAEGATAMYDAVIFSLLQFEGRGGRRALVVLSDGDDVDSRYGPKRVAERAREAGVPVYLIGLGSLDIFERSYSKRDLRRVTEETGGRLYFVESFAELDSAYAEINAELRSQYTLSIYVDDDLTADERESIDVRVPRGLRARAVVGVDAD